MNTLKLIIEFMKKHISMSFFVLILAVMFLSGCGSNNASNTVTTNPENYSSENTETDSSANSNTNTQSNTNPNEENNLNNETTSSQQTAQSQPVAEKKGPIPMIIDANKGYSAILHTEAGDIEVELNAKETPITVNNFVSLAKKGFYDNTIFHRAIKGFMIQGGDPSGDGSGGPGYKFDDESFTGEYTRGILAMANAGPNTNGSQFFIMHQDYPLPKNYVIFGKVLSGMDSVDKIAEAEVTASASGEISKPVKPVKITSIEIIEK
jgi:cyclophilin family peptidyl-prolyl cis-trans isomerase